MASEEHGRLVQQLELQLTQLKQSEERRRLLGSGILQAAVATIKQLLDSPSGCESRALLLAFRLLRNCAALEPEVAGPALIGTHMQDCLVTAVTALSASPCDEGRTDCLTALSQLLANWMGCQEAAAIVGPLFLPEGWQQLTSNSSAGVVIPSTLALYRCCRAQSSFSLQLCQQGSAIFSSLVDHTLRQGHETIAVDQEPQENEWLPLLISCISLRQGLLEPLLHSLGSADSRQGCHGRDTSSSSLLGGSNEHGNPWGWGQHQATVLHLLAHEVAVMKDASPVGMPAEPHEGARDLPGPTQPWSATLACVVNVIQAAAQSCCQQESQESLAQGSASGLQRSLASHVLEAAFEVLKHLMLREDQGCQLFGADPITHLVEEHSLMHLLLAMLHALEPVTVRRRKSRQPGPGLDPEEAAGASSSMPDAAAGPSDSGAAAQRPPPVHPDLAPLVSRLPVQQPYVGYRGDVLAVLSNAMFGRPSICKCVVSLSCVEITLAQCQLDENSPLAREWALWAVRNLCAGSEEAQQVIKDLEVVSAVETPELQKLGMRMELDKQTGQMKLVRTEKANDL